MLVDQAADAAIGELRSQLSETLVENAKLRSHLDNQASDILPTLMLTHTERASHRLLLSHRTLDEL